MTGGMVLVHRAMWLDSFVAGPEHERAFDYSAQGSGAEDVMALPVPCLVEHGSVTSMRFRVYRGREGHRPPC